MQSSYYARLRRKMILDTKKIGVDSFNGASPSQDTINSCKLKSTRPDKFFFVQEASFIKPHSLILFQNIVPFFYCQLPTFFYFLLIGKQMNFLIVFCHSLM